eukprot:CAMPEP_0116155672 /NCGR_PEP_ID=MMETSP0329-20121206/22435_1 /TAXON_ID=697910 /ORGANISM="Pseudo-nitzschia arenysensis, Strain B593" /LENGTH=257 /DNA_ID=CAMNT_0003652727 /DNA_START=9 /DNA_END=782 /DNA_ORIENTATION=+
MIQRRHANRSTHYPLAAAFAVIGLLLVFCSSSNTNYYKYLYCQALSAPSKLAIPNPLSGIFGQGGSKAKAKTKAKTNNKFRIQLFDPTKETESMLQNLQDCRRTAFDPNKQNWMDSERDFVAAKKVTDGMNLCAVAIDTSTRAIVGSADLTPSKKGTTNVVTNVFVTPDQRGKGIGRLLMVEGIEQILAKELPSNNLKDNDSAATISLDVYTNNKAAFQLYQKLGYEPSSAMHSGTMAMAKTLGANFVVSMSKIDLI